MIIVKKKKRGDSVLRGEFESQEELDKATKKCFKSSREYKKEDKEVNKKLDEAFLKEIEDDIRSWEGK